MIQCPVLSEFYMYYEIEAPICCDIVVAVYWIAYPFSVRAIVNTQGNQWPMRRPPALTLRRADYEVPHADQSHANLLHRQAGLRHDGTNAQE
jgi:hypothetical protein